MSAKAIVERIESISIMVDMRPPKKGELAYCVSRDADPHDALTPTDDEIREFASSYSFDVIALLRLMHAKGWLKPLKEESGG